MSTPLNVLTLPLTGRHLIEASAGTGKTWTIAALYLRQLLQHRRELGQVLVVTFTEAAVAELRERIRARLIEARDVLGGQPPGQPDGKPAADDFLANLIASLTDRDGARTHLDDALARLDDMAVYTIHGFCGRVLADHAFSAGSRFEADIEPNNAPLDAEILGDFWRQQCAAATPTVLDLLYQCWPQGPHSLTGTLGKLVRRAQLRLLPQLPPGAVAAAQAVYADAARVFGAEWACSRDDVLSLLRDYPGLSRTQDNGYKPADLETLFGSIDAWFVTSPQMPQGMSPAHIERLSSLALAGSLTATAIKKGGVPPQHPLFDAAAALTDARVAFANVVRVRTVLAALRFMREQGLRRRAARGQRGFDDLLQELAGALDAPGGMALAGALASRYSVVMIDEFQDTDPVQYRLFAALHAAGAAGHSGLYLIGDPKQAIYQFRGADVFAYLAARAQIPPRQRHTLGTNQRSTAALVAAVNAVFQQHPRPFVLDQPGQEIEFHPATAAGRREAAPLRVDGAPLPALAVWWLPHGEKALSKESAGQQALAATAARVAQLLSAGAEGRACVGNAPLAGQHIGILVNSNKQAADAQQALRSHGVASVCLRQDSVYDSAQAVALERLLAAALDPTDGNALRTALATPLIGATAAQIAALIAPVGGDEAAWEDYIGLFAIAHRRWQAAGPLPMLLGLLEDAGIVGRLRATDDGARALTNLLHLGELLQAQAASRPGLDAQLRFLRDAIANPDNRAETQQLRLESDANLVQIVTLHKAKGLEWEIVFLPFVWDEKKPETRTLVEFHDATDLVFSVDLAANSPHAERARQEALAERVRLLYVALTRARQHCALPFGVISQAEHGALGWLLYGGLKPGPDDATARAPWDVLARASDGAVVLSEPPTVGAQRVDASADAGHVATFTGRIDSRWRVTSYSALAAGATGTDRPDHDAVDASNVVAVPETPIEPVGGSPNIARFPRGAAAGTSLHALFEALDFPTAHGPDLAAAVSQTLLRAGYPPRWQPTLEQLVTDVLDTPLDGQNLRLRGIDRSHRRDELEFYFPLARVDAAALNARLVAHGRFADAPALRFDAVEGMLKGYIDLTFEHAGRFYLADYKSNWLGPTSADYQAPALRAAMAEHRYDLQYLVYTVALHRHLRLRVPGYDYARHFGGAYYLFLRGMGPGQGTAGVYFDRPDLALVRALEAVLCGDG